LQSQLVPVSPVASVVTYASSPSINNISPGPSILPIIWYTFNDYTTGSTTVKNSGTLGASYNGTLYGNPTFPVHVKTLNKSLTSPQFTCLSLSGSSQYVSIPSFSFGGGNYTICFWYKYTSTGNFSRIFDFGNGAPSNNILVSLHNTNTLNFYKNDSNGLTDNTTLMTSTSNDSTWRHIALVYTITSGTSGNLVSYVNGANTKSIATTTPLKTSRTNHYIGRSNWSTDAYFNGFISDFRVYETALNNAQINSIVYSAFLPTVPFNLAPFSWSTAAPTGYTTTSTGGVITIPSVLGAYCYCNFGSLLLGKTISFDFYTTALCNFAFWCTSPSITSGGSGYMYRFEARGGTMYTQGHLFSLGSWSSWPTTKQDYNGVSASTWYHASVVIGTTNTTSLYINGALVVGSENTYATMPSSTNNTYFGFIGDGALGSNSSQFKNFSIV